MNDCISFIKTNKFQDNFKLFFDQIMALYNLVGRYEIVNINTTSYDNVESIEFVLTTDSVDDMEYIYSNLNTKTINLYGHIYTTIVSMAGTNLILKLIEEASG